MKKTVRFELNPKIHWLVTYDFAYRQSRIGYWEQHARDRVRFQNRILHVEKKISKIFNINHREKIFKELQIL